VIPAAGGIRGNGVATRTNSLYARELARAAAGALLFAFPLMMTMEMWWIGFYLDPVRFALFILVGFALLLGLSYYSGFQGEEGWRDVIMDTLSGFAVAVAVSALFLGLFGVLQFDMPLGEIVGKVGLVAIPAGIGALVARKQFQSSGDDDGEERADHCSYAGELFLMFGGAVFIAFNVAPTDEIELIAHMMTPWHGLLLAAVTIAIQHALVYNLEFSGQETWPRDRRFAFVFFNYTVAGYGVALAVSLYVIWTFGRTDGMPLTEVANLTVVLGFPAALGAATARLVI
jgi:putative integral membrane protein (TIGR02587 family)